VPPEGGFVVPEQKSAIEMTDEKEVQEEKKKETRVRKKRRGGRNASRKSLKKGKRRGWHPEKGGKASLSGEPRRSILIIIVRGGTGGVFGEKVGLINIESGGRKLDKGQGEHLEGRGDDTRKERLMGGGGGAINPKES